MEKQTALKVLHHVRDLNPALPVVVRTRDDADLELLLAAGASEVVPETFESSLTLASHALVLLGIPLKRVVRRIRAVRDHRYSLLRGFFQGESDSVDDPDELRSPRLHSIAIEPGAFACGKTLAQIDLDPIGASVSAIKRRDKRLIEPPPNTRVEAGDVLVLLGTPEQLVVAEMRLLKGRS